MMGSWELKRFVIKRRLKFFWKTFWKFWKVLFKITWWLAKQLVEIGAIAAYKLLEEKLKEL